MGRTWWLLAAAAASLACATNTYDGGPASPIRLDCPAAVGWEPGGPFQLDLTVYNATGHRLSVVKPEADALQVKVFGADGRLACKTLNPTYRSHEAWDARYLLPSTGLRLAVDIWPYCRNLTVGVYRYEAFFVANRSSATDVWVGTLGPQGGRIAVGQGLSTDEGALAAALSAQRSTAPAAETGTAAPAAGAAAAAPPPAATPPSNPEAIRACVDRELSARGLNAYGDPQGTRYDEPPVPEGGRILYVASRNVEIRVACGIPGF